jgi:hypothetical protein
MCQWGGCVKGQRREHVRGIHDTYAVADVPTPSAAEIGAATGNMPWKTSTALDRVASSKNKQIVRWCLGCRA